MTRIRSIAVSLAAMAILVGAVPTTAGEPGPSPVSNSRRISAVAQQRTQAYWTEARMQNARAALAPVPNRRTPITGISQDAGPAARLVEGSEPGDTSRPVGVSPAEYAYPYPYTRYAVDTVLYTLAPYRTVGKIFFRQGTTDYVCSGASVAGGPRHIVFTAGHCLNNGAGVYSTRVLFVPAYRIGNRPFGTFAARQLWVYDVWSNGGDSSYDYGAFDVGPNAAGKTLGKAVGKLGFMWDAPRDLHWSAFGYPAGAPFTGQTMQVCHASRAVDDTGIPGIGPDPLGIGCDQTGGSSGGPWIYRLKRGNFLNSVISYGYDQTMPEGTFGPYFDGYANLLRCAAATGSASATSC